MQNLVFVYILDGDYKCLGMDDALLTGKQLVKDGWKHSATVKPEVWMSNFLNGNERTRFEAIESVSA